MTQPQTSLVLVEDDEVAVMAVRRAASSLGLDFRLLHARDGAEALDLLRARVDPMVEVPFLVLLDINMPRMNGLEFLANLRKDPGLKNVVVFVMTTSDAPSDIRASYDHNVAGYIVKSFGKKTLQSVLRMLNEYDAVVAPFPDLRHADAKSVP